VTECFTRDRIIDLMRELPADATIDDAIEKLLFVARIERGIAELDAGQGVPHDEVKRRLDELVAAGVIQPPQEPGDPFSS
jgi:predicted transcriptional regulator